MGNLVGIPKYRFHPCEDFYTSDLHDLQTCKVCKALNPKQPWGKRGLKKRKKVDVRNTHRRKRPRE